jgi:hypothetical protein
MAASEIVIRDGGISERVMSDVREVTCSRQHRALGFGGYDGRNEGGGDRLLKKNNTKPNLRMVSIVGMSKHEE